MCPCPTVNAWQPAGDRASCAASDLTLLMPIGVRPVVQRVQGRTQGRHSSAQQPCTRS
jgi:hypothetical protein